ncbi:MAG: TatD family hydrolase [Candidatus Omnitrophota bacterium]
MVQLIDTHCHLDFPEFEQDRDEVIKRAKENGIDYLINVGSSLQGSKDSLELALNYDCIYAVVGIHPHEADNTDNAAIAVIEDLAKKNKVVAIGEIGLDYYRNYSAPQNQKRLFTALIKLAKSLNLPLVLHSRQAEEETLNIIKEFTPQKAVVHCFSGSEDFLRQCLDLGLFISFTCNITYKKAENLKNVVKLVPLERIMLETDCPYLPPEGFRGRRNEPFQVKLLAEEISKIKGIPFGEIARVSTENAKVFFNIPS